MNWMRTEMAGEAETERQWVRQPQVVRLEGCRTHCASRSLLTCEPWVQLPVTWQIRRVPDSDLLDIMRGRLWKGWKWEVGRWGMTQRQAWLRAETARAALQT
jgi:hypothetical protein